jgi:hypothetical protein
MQHTANKIWARDDYAHTVEAAMKVKLIFYSVHIHTLYRIGRREQRKYNKNYKSIAKT